MVMPMSTPDTRGRHDTKVLAIASGGGHWVQLMRVLPAFDGCDVVFATVHPEYRSQVAPRRLHVVPDANQYHKLGVLRLMLRLAWIVLRERPDVIVSTGAAPGCIGVWFGRLVGARTIWIDSIANVDRLSLSGNLVRRTADLWLTQWPHLASSDGPHYVGAVL
jgi:UDP-N-acetylglucosamine:LPS N-acetylglucosamine transferase